MTDIRTGTSPVCPCCGAAYLKPRELAVLVALYAANGEVSIEMLARATDINTRTVRRALSGNPALFERVLRYSVHTHAWHAFYFLTDEGTKAARRVVGSSLEAAE